MILNNINRINKKKIYACHGKYHTCFVINTAEYILQSLSYSSKIVDLGKTAALLHDIGIIAGRKNHAQKSVALASVFLNDYSSILPDEKEMILQAVEDHSKGINISSAIGAALIIADKADISKNRLLPDKKLDAWHENLLNLRKVEINIANSAVFINFITSKDFSKPLFIEVHNKYISLPIKASSFLGCSCHFMINGKEESLLKG